MSKTVVHLSALWVNHPSGPGKTRGREGSGQDGVRCSAAAAAGIAGSRIGPPSAVAAKGRPMPKHVPRLMRTHPCSTCDVVNGTGQTALGLGLAAGAATTDLGRRAVPKGEFRGPICGL